jgi:selenocysteine lyase/cysteine desulfurase
VRNGNELTIEIVGFSTARELTQAAYTFAAAAGQTLQSSTVTTSVEDLFNRWFQEPSSGQYGSQFFFTQRFTISRDANSVTPQSVTLTNRMGSTSANITP